MADNKTLCLGFSALNNWEILMIKEGLIEKYHDDFHDKYIKPSPQHMRIDNKSFLLFSIVLFDKIDASYLSTFNMERLIEAGLVDEHAHMVESKLDYLDQDPTNAVFKCLSARKSYDSTPELLEIKQVAEDIMAKNKHKILNAIRKDDAKHEYYFFRHHEIKRFFDKWITDCEFWENSIGFPEGKTDLGIVKKSIMYGLYHSAKCNSIYYDGNISFNNKFSIENHGFTGQDVYQVMNVDLSPELYNLPIPTTLQEALYLRSRPEIVSFREVFFEWCKALQGGDVDLTMRIKSDITLAQKGLEKYYKWENSRVKFFNCLIDMAVSLIPYLSTAVGIISPFQTRNVLKRRIDNSWVLLLK